MAYADSFSNSFGEKVIGDILTLESTGAFKQESVPRALPRVDQTLEGIFKNGANGLDSPESLGLTKPAIEAPKTVTSASWTFITAPEDVSWDVANQATRVDIFGTNNPPVVAGSRGMRDLTLGNSLVEGFVRGVTVEGKIAALEKLMNYTLNQKDGFVGVPVYRVKANDKTYGNGNGYFIIKDIKIKETMRDTRGDATRAYVDISLMEVPEYQVNSGRDLASQPAAAAKALALPQSGAGATGTAGAAGAAAGTLGAGQSGAKAGATSASPDKGAGGGVTPVRPTPGNPIKF